MGCRADCPSMKPTACELRAIPYSRSSVCEQGRWAVAKIPPGVGPKHPQVVVLVGATGDLSKRKLLPGLFHLVCAGFIPGCRIIGVSLEDIDAQGFRKLAREALDEFSTRKFDDA